MARLYVKTGGFIGSISVGGWDNERYPCPPAEVVPNPRKCVHTPMPTGYLEWNDWCERASRTHSQVDCPHCGKCMIWLPKAKAAAYRKDRAVELLGKKVMTAMVRRRRKTNG